jgi:CheY-like chemotaxis protein
MSHSTPSTSSAVLPGREKPATVLVVDDDPDFVFQQKLHLEGAGFRVRTAGGETAALASLAEERPDLVVLDLMMENADGGFTLCYRIKKNDPSLPVVLVTSVNAETGLDFGTDTTGQRAWIRADAFLSKPIRFEQLRREIDRLLGGRA